MRFAHIVYHTFIAFAFIAFLPAKSVAQEAAYYTVTASLTGDGSISPATQEVEAGKIAVFQLTLTDADAFVVIGGSCEAARSESVIETSAINSDCDVQVSVYPATDVEPGSDVPAAPGESFTFKLIGGAGDKELERAILIRADIEADLALSELEPLLKKDEGGENYIFTAERTGRYILSFRDVVSGEISDVKVDVWPYIAFTSNRQSVQLNTQVTVELWVSDEPAFYPVTANLSVSGSEAAEISIGPEDELRGVYELTQVNTITDLLLSEPVNALLGDPASHELAPVDELPLKLEIVAEQQNVFTSVVSQDGGEVALSVNAPGATAATVSWSSTDLPVNDGDTQTVVFDPAGILEGTYQVVVNVESEDGRSGVYTLNLELIAHCLDNACRTVSGIPDQENPFAKEQRQRLVVCPSGDGADRVSQCRQETTSTNTANAQEAIDQGYIEALRGHQLKLGADAMAQSWDEYQFGIAVTNIDDNNSEGFEYKSAVINFTVSGLLSAGASGTVVIALPTGNVIPADATWLMYSEGREHTSQNLWKEFEVDGKNRIESATLTASGSCPQISAMSWQDGLIEGHRCIRLTIEDGGPNDKETSNYVIGKTGVLAVATETDPIPMPELPPLNTDKSSGSFSYFLMLGLGLFMLGRRRVRAQFGWKPISS